MNVELVVAGVAASGADDCLASQASGGLLVLGSRNAPIATAKGTFKGELPAWFEL
eukprot:CAMPEP_0171115538 /NCGR_PEP_ID=MMETSP0766_2-20121228/88106_1 /TAXON_ID=439317 /ORGANISM="Gambierdiscus australes, Strain CAWD 149" /LENGTH=54 /DNA_ID=CAMNT_0011577905 /DNA_START=139 /DNA_END=301 /DNA_ORIENTATION=-